MIAQPEWTHVVRLSDLARGPISLALSADAPARRAIAARLGLPELKSLTAEARIRPWLDGAEMSGRINALVVQESGVSLDLFDQEVETPLEVRVVPRGSPHAPDEAAELDVDPEAPDPPDILDGEEIDVAAYVIEHLALAIDPFPRKPGETFDYAPPQDDDSPFAVLKRLKDPER